MDADRPTAAPTSESAFVILNWNGCEDTCACVASLLDQGVVPGDVVIVDNGSSDASLETFANCFPGVTVVETGENLGWAGGNNAGLAHVAAQRRYAFAIVLNNDTVALDRFDHRLVETARAHPEAAFIIPKIHYFDAPDVEQYAGRAAPDDINVADYALFAEGRYDGPRRRGPTYDFYGAAFLLRLSCLDTIGYADGTTFLQFDETEWMTRAVLKGYAVYYEDRCTVLHKVSRSFGHLMSPMKAYYSLRNMATYYRTYRFPASFVPVVKQYYYFFHNSVVGHGRNFAAFPRRLWLKAFALAVFDALRGTSGRVTYRF